MCENRPRNTCKSHGHDFRNVNKIDNFNHRAFKLNEILYRVRVIMCAKFGSKISTNAEIILKKPMQF